VLQSQTNKNFFNSCLNCLKSMSGCRRVMERLFQTRTLWRYTNAVIIIIITSVTQSSTSPWYNADIGVLYLSASICIMQNFRYKGSPPTNHSSQKTRLNDLSYGIKIWTQLSSILSQCMHLTNGRSDRQTDGRRAFSSLYSVCIPCSAVTKQYS